MSIVWCHHAVCNIRCGRIEEQIPRQGDILGTGSVPATTAIKFYWQKMLVTCAGCIHLCTFVRKSPSTLVTPREAGRQAGQPISFIRLLVATYPEGFHVSQYGEEIEREREEASFKGGCQFEITSYGYPESILKSVERKMRILWETGCRRG